MPDKIHIGNLEYFFDEKKVEGKQIKIKNENFYKISNVNNCLLYTSPSPRDGLLSRMPSSA